MDVVYLCRRGPNEELRYSLRSLKHIEHGRVWIFGEPPPWVTGAEVVRIEQAGEKRDNARANLDAALSTEELSDRFVLMNDDFFAMRPTAVVPLHWGPLAEVYDRYVGMTIKESAYMAFMRRTLLLLRGLGIPEPRCYDLHVPMVFEKAKLAEVISTYCSEPGMLYRSVYGNVFGVGGEEVDDVKVYGGAQEVPCGPWLSCNDATFAHVRPHLHAALSAPGPYEDPRIFDRRVTVGLLS